VGVKRVRGGLAARASRALCAAALIAACAGALAGGSAAAGPAAGGRARPADIECGLRQGASQDFKVAVNLDKEPIQKVDILFVFDVTGSMRDELSAAQDQGKALMQYVLDKVAPDAHFGVASFCDYPGEFAYSGYSAEYGASDDYPWHVDQPITDRVDDANSAIGDLSIHDGKDDPEDYGRVYDECARDATVGWRTDTKRIVVIFGDAAPHDQTFDGDNTGGDPGRDGVANTSDDVKFKDAVAKLAAHSTAVLAVNCGGEGEAIDAFKYVVDKTNGQYADLGDADKLKDTASAIVRKETATVDKLSASVTGPAKSWVQVDPTSASKVKGGDTVNFTVHVSAPKSAALGTSDAMVHFIADGYEICQTQVNVLVKGPKKPTGFDPARDGWGFHNAGSHTSWDAFLNYFGKDLIVSPSGHPYYAAENYYEIWNRIGSGGSCFGLAASAIAAQQKGLAVPTRRSGQNLVDVKAPDSEPSGMFGRNTLGLFIGDYQARQIDARFELMNDEYERSQLLSGKLMTKPEPNQVLSQITDYLDQGQPVIVCIADYDPSQPTELKRWEGHAIVATDYKVSGATTRVHVYDSNHPMGKPDSWIEFNTDDHSWRYELSDGWWWSYAIGGEQWNPTGGFWGTGAWESMSDTKRKAIGLDCLISCAPVDTVLSPGVAPWNPARLSQEGWATVDKLESITWLDIEHGLGTSVTSGGQVLERVGPYVASGDSTGGPDVAMYVADNPAGMSFTLDPQGSEAATAALFAQGSFSSLSVQPGQSVAASVTAAGTADVSASAGASATYSYAVSRESTGSSHVVQIESAKVGAAPDQISAGDDLSTLQVIKGAGSSYDVRVESIGTQDLVFGSDDVTSSAGDRQVVSVPSWDSMESTPPVLLIDHGNKGSFDQTITLRPMGFGGGGGGGGSSDDSSLLFGLLGVALAGGIGWSALKARSNPDEPEPDPLIEMAAPRPKAPGPSETIMIGRDGRSFGLGAGEHRIGRADDADIVVAGRATSRQHATITIESGVATVRDTGSTVGTWVNGQQVSEAVLRDGDVVRFGEEEFVFRRSAEGADS
jgi:hypothetical protein